jgi:hypothetical protein
VCPIGRFPTLRESRTTQSRKSLFLCTEVYPRLCRLGGCLARLVTRQNDAESAKSIEERRPGDTEQYGCPGQLPVGFFERADDMGAFRISEGDRFGGHLLILANQFPDRRLEHWPA